MGAIRPYHITFICCMLSTAALIGGLVLVAINRVQKNNRVQKK